MTDCDEHFWAGVAGRRSRDLERSCTCSIRLAAKRIGIADEFNNLSPAPANQAIVHGNGECRVSRNTKIL